MNCIILLLLLCSCGGCGNGVSGNSNGNCACDCNHHHHHHHNHRRQERMEDACEAVVSESSCERMERTACDAANMAPPSWREFPGLTRDCDCDN